MRRMLMIILTSIIALLLLGAFLGVLRTWQMEHTANQKLFAAGSLPKPAPDGLYAGTVPGHQVSWLGKRFNAKAEAGINIFKNEDGSEREQYPFKTATRQGVHDPALTLLAIDYDTSTNPWWLRPVLDEVVETAPGHLLGKLQLRLIPGYPFTLIYFKLAAP